MEGLKLQIGVKRRCKSPLHVMSLRSGDSKFSFKY